jgi:uncharacterized membrane protein YbhN (UPF0104 family)
MKAVKLAVRIVVSLAVSAVFVWLSLRHTDVRAVGAAIAGADPLRLVGYLGLLLVVHLIKTVRWGILLEPLGHVPFRRLNSASAVGFMLLMLLPLRLGELARPLLIARPPPGQAGVRIRRSGAMASCVVERIIDGLSVGVLGIVALRLLGASASGRYAAFARNAALLVALGFLGLFIALTLAFFLRPQALRLTRALVSPLSPRLAGRLAESLDAFISALHLGSAPRVLAPAFGMHLGSLMAMTVLAIQVVGVMVPAGPGMIGTTQFFTQVGLSLFFPVAIPQAAVRAAAFANTLWLLQFGQQIGLGLVFLLAGHVSLRGLFRRDDAPPEDEEGDSPARSPAATAAP